MKGHKFELCRGLNATSVENPVGGLLEPGATTTTSLNTDVAPDNNRLSIVAMFLPSNDGFMGLNAMQIPTDPGPMSTTSTPMTQAPKRTQ